MQKSENRKIAQAAKAVKIMRMTVGYVSGLTQRSGFGSGDWVGSSFSSTNVILFVIYNYTPKYLFIICLCICQEQKLDLSNKIYSRSPFFPTLLAKNENPQIPSDLYPSVRSSNDASSVCEIIESKMIYSHFTTLIANKEARSRREMVTGTAASKRWF